MKFTTAKIAAIVMAASVLAGCANPADQYGADVYQVGQLNSRQETKTVNIISVLPAKVAVDNSRNREAAQTVGAIIGIIAGAAIGYNTGADAGFNGAAGAGAGGAVGAIAGSAVSATKMVDGVSLTYKDDTKVYTSTQLGKQCQFTSGLAVVITTKANETRIQPNATCPESK